MKPITISLSEKRTKELQEKAQRLGLPAEALIQASIDELLAEPDTVLEDAINRVIKKNEELYQRLG